MPDNQEDPTPRGQALSGYQHVAQLGPGGPQSAQALAPVLQAGLALGHPVVLACSEPLAAALHETLDDGRPDAPVHTVDPAPLGGRVPDALAGYTALIDRFSLGGPRLQLVTDGCPTGPGLPSWLQTEALLNHVLADRAVDHFCVLDPADLGSEADRALSCHAQVVGDEGVADNPLWRDPADVLRSLWSAEGPDPLESTSPVLAIDDVTDMRGLRRALTSSLANGPLDPDDAEDLVLAIDEVTSNAAEHGIPPVDVRLWVTAQRVLCAVVDRGPGFDEPLAGYGPAHGQDLSLGGMGLWLARRAVDRMTTSPIHDTGDGCVVRLLIDPRLREHHSS